jgi:hypothetical protein
VGIKLFFNITFHPQIDGQTKWVNGVLKEYLKNYVNTDKINWGEHISLAKFCYNSTMHLVTRMSPFELTLGKETKKRMDLAILMG